MSKRSEPGRLPLGRRIWRERWMYLLILPGFLFFVVFRYLPLLGNIAAFQDYSPYLGFAGSAWTGLENFTKMFSDPEVITATKNTLVISLLQVVFAFPVPLALALLLNSIVSGRVKRFIQSVVYLPHFISWVIVVAIWQQVLGGDGLMSNLIGDPTFNLMGDPDFFKILVTLQVIWKDTGWNTIIFLAVMTRIDQSQYESASIDGAGSSRRIWHVTLPAMRSIFILLLILRLGSVLTVGFEQILLQQPAVGAQAAQVLDTFTYYRGVLAGDWGMATMAGLIKGVVGTAMVIGANRIAKRMGSEGAF